MQSKTQPLSAAWIAHAVPYVCSGAILIVILLHLHSLSKSDVLEIDGLGTALLTFNSTEGRIVLGVVEKRTGRWWGRRGPSTAYVNLARGDYFGFAADPWGWGICVPHGAIVVVLLIPIAWWWFIFRHRDEELHRIEKGLCHHCGYDVSHSHGRCPECGELQSNAVWNAPLPVAGD